MRLKRSVGVALIALVVFSCSKDQLEVDYRAVYFGQFDFTVISDYSGQSGSGMDTNFYENGVVRAYAEADKEQNFYLDDPAVANENKIVVEISEDLTLTAVLSTDGMFVKKTDEYFSQTGGFEGYDKLLVNRYVSSPATFDHTNHSITGIRQ